MPEPKTRDYTQNKGSNQTLSPSTPFRGIAKLVNMRTTQGKAMSLIAIEDQSPIMRRAKIRVAVAIALLLVAAGSLLMLNEQAPSLPKSTASAIVAAAPAKTAAPKVAPLPPPAKPAPAVKEPDAKPPVAPPDPVYTSFTAPAEEPAAPTPVEPAAAPAPENKPAPAEVAQNPQPAAKPAAHKPEPAAAKLETSPTGSHILQAGVFADMGNARKQQSKLAASGISAHTSTKLRIGPFPSIEEAEAAREKVRSSGINITLADNIESSARGQSLAAGQYADMDQAKRLQASLSEHGLPAHTETRLLVGPFANKAKADAARNKIKKLNISVVLMPNN